MVQEIARETGAKRDGTGKNLIVPRCPFCGKSGGKFGIYIGPETARREPFMAHCFSCGKSTRTLGQLLEAIGRNHYMNTHGGCASTEELGNLDGEETAILLMESTPATVTRYGVVYDRGRYLCPKARWHTKRK